MTWESEDMTADYHSFEAEVGGGLNSVGVSLCGHPFCWKLLSSGSKGGAHRGTPLQN